MGEPYDPADQAYDLFPLKRAVRFGAVFVEAAACRPFGECRNNDNMVYAEKFFAPDGFPRPRGTGSSTAETGVGTGGGLSGEAARAEESGDGVGGGAGSGGGANDHSSSTNASLVNAAAARAVSGATTTVIAEDETVFFAQQLPVRLNRWDPCHVGKGTVGRAAKVPKAEEFDLATCAREQYLRVDDRTGEVSFDDGGWSGEPPHSHFQSSPPLLPGVVATDETTTTLPTAPGRAAAGGGGRGGGGGRARGDGGAAAVSAARQGGANRYAIDDVLHKDLVS